MDIETDTSPIYAPDFIPEDSRKRYLVTMRKRGGFEIITHTWANSPEEAEHNIRFTAHIDGASFDGWQAEVTEA